MSDARNGDGEAKRQQAFDAQAEALGFTLEQRSFAEGEHHGIGIIPIPAVSRIVSVGATPTEEAEGDEQADETKVKYVIQCWESIHPDRVAEEGPNLVTDPFLVVDDDRVETIDHKALKAAPATDEFRLTCERFPVSAAGRDVTLSAWCVVFIGSGRAAATYQLHENFTNGTCFEGKGAAILLRDGASKDGWRITVMTKHRRVAAPSA